MRALCRRSAGRASGLSARLRRAAAAVAAAPATAPAAPVSGAASVAAAASETDVRWGATQVPPPASASLTPAEADALSFELAPSVARWRAWTAPAPGSLRLSDVVNDAAEAVRRDGPSYWAHHLARTLFFATNGVAALALQGRLGEHPATRLLAPADGPAEASLSLAERLGPAARLVAEALATYDQDGDNVDVSLGHRQYGPAFIAERCARFVREADATLKRRSRGTPDDVWLKSSSSLYPEYYLKSWHYQTDGWLSPDSAAVYDTSTETLFIGRQDAMQRCCGLALLARHLRSPAAGDEVDPFRPPRVLDVACGTGRLLSFVRDAFPDAQVTGLDLSPFYLAEARGLHAHWEALRGHTGEGGATWVHANAEAMPLPDASFDAVSVVYLLHELPPASRARVAAEVFRVLRPGGVAVVVDSVQRGDRPALDKGLVNFKLFNEPEYDSFIEEDLGATFAAAGLQPWRKEVASATKGLAFVKPRA